jgi:hypothetical protein
MKPPRAVTLLTAAAAIVLAGLVVVILTGCSHSASPHSAAPRPNASHSTQTDIYKLLPFSQNQLDVAYTSAARASAAYQTFSYTDTPASYGSREAQWVTPTYLSYLEQTFGNPAATTARARLLEHSSATSSVLSIRTFGPTSITFITHIAQTDPVTHDSGDYAVTVATTDGRGWLVSDIEPAAAGNS